MPSRAERVNPLVIYVHIPRTAGTTLGGVIRRQYPRDGFVEVYSLAVDHATWLQSLSAVQRDRIELLKGHLPFGLHAIFGRPAAHFTLLREPVDRVVSLYRYAWQNPDHYLHEEIVRKSLTLREVLSRELSLEFDNGQTRQLAGVTPAVGFGRCTAVMLEEAKRNLQNHFTVVGITERFDETLLLLKEAFGWRNLFYIKENIAHGLQARYVPSEDTLRRVRDQNSLDGELYDWVREALERQLAEQGILFRTRLAAFRMGNAIFGGVGGVLRWFRSHRRGRWIAD
jgi:hypothetical protein